MDYTKIKLDDVKFAEYNPRQISTKELDKLKESLRKLGCVRPLIINKRSGILISGHQTVKAARELGITELDYITVDLNEIDERLLNTALNRISGDWDDDKLSTLLALIKEKEESALIYTGFDNREVFRLLKDLDASREDNFNVAAAYENNKYKVQIGDIWQLGNHRILCGDCTIKENMAKLMDGKTADLVFTDPPYNFDIKHRGNRPEEIQQFEDDFSTEDYNILLDKMIISIDEYLKKGGPFYICNGWKNYHKTIIAILKNKEFLFHQCIVWYKHWPVMGRTDYLKDFELIIYGWKKGEKHLFNPGQSGDVDVWEIKKDNPLEYMHLTQKPVELPYKAIKNSSKENDLVLDTFLGSGSTLIACEQLNRVCYGMELNPHYVSTIIERFEAFTSKKAIKL